VSPHDERRPVVEIHPEPIPDGIAGIITSRNGSAPSYVLSSPVSVGAIDNALTIAHPQIRESSRVVFMTEPLLTFFLRYINPMLYYRLHAARDVRGDDVVARIRPPSQAGVRRFFCFEAARMLQLPTRLGSGQLPTHRQVMRHERRRECLFHFLQSGEILLNGRTTASTPSEALQREHLLDAILNDMPTVFDKLNNSPTRLLHKNPDSPGDA